MELGSPGARGPVSSKAALDITHFKYARSPAILSDFLLAPQTLIATKVECFGDLTNNRIAVHQLDQAVAKELHQ